MDILCANPNKNFGKNCDVDVFGVEDKVYLFRKSDLDRDAIAAGSDPNNPLKLGAWALKAGAVGYYILGRKKTVAPDATMSRVGSYTQELHQVKLVIQKYDVGTTWALELVKEDDWVFVTRNNDLTFEVWGYYQGLIVKEYTYTPTVGETRRAKPITFGSDDAFQEPYKPATLLIGGDGAATLAALEALIYAEAFITPASLPNTAVGAPYSQTLSETGIAGTVTWSVSSGTLPTGLTLNSSSGLISGTATTAQTRLFTIQATDGVNTAQKTYAVTVTP
jgi:hypothetical protein